MISKLCVIVIEIMSVSIDPLSKGSIMIMTYPLIPKSNIYTYESSAKNQSLCPITENELLQNCQREQISVVQTIMNYLYSNQD